MRSAALLFALALAVEPGRRATGRKTGRTACGGRKAAAAFVHLPDAPRDPRGQGGHLSDLQDGPRADPSRLGVDLRNEAARGRARRARPLLHRRHARSSRSPSPSRGRVQAAPQESTSRRAPAPTARPRRRPTRSAPTATTIRSTAACSSWPRDNTHHLEGAYLATGVFRMYFYDDFTKPQPVAELRNFKATLMVKDAQDREGYAVLARAQRPLSAGDDREATAAGRDVRAREVHGRPARTTASISRSPPTRRSRTRPPTATMTSAAPGDDRSAGGNAAGAGDRRLVGHRSRAGAAADSRHRARNARAAQDAHRTDPLASSTRARSPPSTCRRFRPRIWHSRSTSTRAS